jgi:hypothetical protein
MNEALAHFFEDCTVAPGALGCGARLPDRTCLVRSYAPSCTAESLEKSLHHLADATSLFAGHGLASNLLAWTFATGRLYVAARPDGALFVLVTRADVDAGEFFSEVAGRFFMLANNNHS